MTEVVFAIPGDLATPTGGYVYDRHLVALLPERGIDLRHCALPGSFPWAPVHDLVTTQALLQSTPPDAIILADGLAFGAMTELVLKSIERRFVALIHHPLALETGLCARRRRALAASERAALARAEAVIVTSAATARILAEDYAVAAERVTVAEPGTAPRPAATGSAKGAPVALLAVGAVSPRKGYLVLVEALAELADLAWSLTVVGALDRDPEASAALLEAIARTPVAQRITLAGALDDDALAQAYAAADLLVHPALYEGYGMVLGEAMACGLPIVAASGGATAQTLAPGAGLLVPPGEPGPLAEALRTMLTREDLRAACAKRARIAGGRLPTWSDTADRVAAVLRAMGA